MEVLAEAEEEFEYAVRRGERIAKENNYRLID
jgi:hypothetical protein